MSGLLIRPFYRTFVFTAISNCSRSMSGISVYVTRPDVPKAGVDILLSKGYNVDAWTEDRPVPRSELLKNIVNKDALFCMLTDKIDAEVLDKAGSRLKVVATMSVGFEHLDVAELKKRNIVIGYTPGVLTDAVAELTLGLLLATSHRMFEAHRAMMNGQWSAWSPSWMCGPSLKGSTVGIVGFGRIGQQLTRLLQPLGVSTVLYTARTDKSVEFNQLTVRRVDLDVLLSDSDFVIATCSLTPETTGLFGAAAFNKMKPTAIFINSSRGGVVDQDALIEALSSKKIRAAGLDVMTPEPIPKDHPLLQLDNCVVIPHLGSASIETRAEMAQMTARNIVAALEHTTLPAEL